jgi:hypothetical protein
MATVSYYTAGGKIRSIASASMPTQKMELLHDGLGSVVRTTTSIGPNAHLFNYVYDSRENILVNSESGVPVSATYNAADQLVTNVSGNQLTSFVFDLAGNMTLANTMGVFVTTTYDFENRLYLPKQQPTATSYSLATYLYDPDDLKRTEKLGEVVTTIYSDARDYLQGRS